MNFPTWDPTAPLERGVTLLEASAGTGKTYSITSVLVRLVAEAGVPIDRILVVTYTRAATAELKERVRDRLVGALAALQGSERPGDGVYARLWDAGQADEAVRLRHLRALREAIEGFDLALISTIHGFCQRMLQQNAFESRADFDLELTPDLDDVLEELVDDFLVRTTHDAEPALIRFYREACGFTRAGLLSLARRAVDDPDVEVVPEPEAADPEAWPALLADVRARWSALADDFVAYVDAQHRQQKAGSLLAPKQRKHTAAAARDWADGIEAWLAGEPSWHAPPPDADRFSRAAMAKQLADPEQGLEHPALDAVQALAGFPGGVASSRRAAFVVQVRRAFEDRKRRARLQAYQDLLRGLARRLGDDADPADREALTGAIGGSFDAALIDEFQDTDAHQWAIFRACFGQGGHHLFLIGDPKQAIYGFRGANVHVYTAATKLADRRFTMTTNWRSDARLLDALNHLLDHPGAFGSVPFGYVPVSAPEARGGADGLRPAEGWGAPASAPLQLRWIPPSALGSTADQRLSKGSVDGWLPARVAEDVVELLRSGTQLRDGQDWRALQPRDVAILVRKGRQAVAVQAALTAVGVPAVLTGAASVLASDEALAIQQWLEALAEPAGGSAARVAASSVLFGWTAERLLAVEAEDHDAVEAWDGWLARLATWRDRLHRRGFMHAFRRALDDEDVLPRLLGFADGERRITNLLHVAELVHAGEVQKRLRLPALLAWLRQRRVEDDLEADELELRLDRDADTVQILTMHKAKGLEFPVCFVPFLWDGALLQKREIPALIVPHPEDPQRRLLDVHVDPKAPPKVHHVARAEREVQEENLRLAYVALTRARHRCVVYTGDVRDYATSPLAAVLHGGGGGDRLGNALARVDGSPEALRSDLVALTDARTAEGHPLVAVADCAAVAGISWSPPPDEVPELATRPFTRGVLDPYWRRHSYTSLTRAAGHAAIGQVEEGREGFDADGVDEDPQRSAPVATGPEEPEVPLAPFPAGAAAGTLLHAVFEKADFQGDRQHLEGIVREQLAVHGFDEARWAELLTDGLLQVLHTPLGEVLGGACLRDVARADRLDELRFDLPLAGGTSPQGAPVDVRALADVLRARSDGRLPASWQATLDRLDELHLTGFLTGSIDLAFRATPPGASRPRWFVLDYKSNRLDPRRTGRCVPSAFDVAGMAHEMSRHDYFLQYHLYLVALHRFLRWRLPDYDYDRDVGGAYYLFFRGMLGPDTARDGAAVRGSFHDRPPREVIEGLDAILQAGQMGGAA